MENESQPARRSFVTRLVDRGIWLAYYGWAWTRSLMGIDKCHPPVRAVRFGNLRRVTPVSENFGEDRGLPVDSYYVEQFMASQSHTIRGRVLECGNHTYTRKFGGDRVEKRDVINLKEGHPNTTFLADLSSAPHIPSNTFDCVIVPKTLQFIYDIRGALATLERILKPGRVLLATFPGISQMSDPEWRDYWYWGFTTRSAQKLLQEAFGDAEIEIESHGNVLAASSFLYGLATKELRPDELDYNDPNYEMLITVKAVKTS